MSNNILAHVKSYLNKVDWMDHASKSSVLQKANAIRTQIAYPDNIYNKTYLESLYQVNIKLFFTKNFWVDLKYLISRLT
jgi:predicted metalloendopeptidase